MISITWDQRHAGILSSICDLYKKENIRYFILRNYEGLPDINTSKDIDIVVDPSEIEHATRFVNALSSFLSSDPAMCDSGCSSILVRESFLSSISHLYKPASLSPCSF